MDCCAQAGAVALEGLRCRTHGYETDCCLKVMGKAQFGSW